MTGSVRAARATREPSVRLRPAEMTRRLRGILGVGALSLLPAAARWGGLAATVLALAGATIGRVPSASR